MAALPHRPPLRGPQIGNRLPPSLPPRAGGRAIRPPPTVQPSVDSDSDPDDYLEPDSKHFAPEEIYDDFDESEDFPDQPDDVYDDCGDKPPPLPPLPVAQPEEYYDDFEEEQPRRPPMRPPAKLPPPIQPLPDVPQETYDDLDNVGPVIVQQISKVRPLPSTPAPPPPVQGIVDEVYEDPDASQLPPWSTNDHSDDIYELNIDEPGMASPPPPPPPPPPPNRTENQGVRRLPPQPRSTPAPAQQASGPGGFSIDMSQLKNLRAGLKKVSVVDSNPAGSSGGGGGNTSPKTYGVCAPSVADAKRKFQEKAEGRPGFLTPKPAIVPKFGATWKAFGATTTTTGANGTPVPPKPVSHTLTPSPKPPLLPPVPADQEEELLNTGVTFLSKVNKDKALPAPVKKLVTRYEPPPPPQEEDYFEDGDIYDDASSGDLLDRYDWYHGILDRKSSEARVKAVGKDGTYLVRVSEKDPRFPYTLVVLNKGHVNNLRIRLRQDGKVAIGDEKPDELTFSDVLNLINHHKTHNVVLLGSNSQSHVALQHTPHKS